jgi:hypothetical protein
MARKCALIRGEVLTKPTVADLIAAEQDRRQSDPPPMARPVNRPAGGEAGPLPSPAICSAGPAASSACCPR